VFLLFSSFFVLYSPKTDRNDLSIKFWSAIFLLFLEPKQNEVQLINRKCASLTARDGYKISPPPVPFTPPVVTFIQKTFTCTCLPIAWIRPANTDVSVAALILPPLKRM
jgi:hypothetical protein